MCVFVSSVIPFSSDNLPVRLCRHAKASHGVGERDERCAGQAGHQSHGGPFFLSLHFPSPVLPSVTKVTGRMNPFQHDITWLPFCWLVNWTINAAAFQTLADVKILV